MNPFDKLISAKRQTTRERQLSSISKKAERNVARIFRKQGNLFVEYFELFKTRFKESVSDDEIERIFKKVEIETESDWITMLEAIYIQSVITGGANLNIALDEDVISFNLKNNRAYDYAVRNSAKLITQVNETTRFQIKQIILKGIDEGDSYDRIARDITKRFKEFAVGKPQQHIDSRAHLVAVTETGNAYEYSSYESALMAKSAGIDVVKRWRTVGDNRVSDGCAQNESNGWIELEQSHSSGHHHPLRFPGCRCHEEYRRRK